LDDHASLAQRLSDLLEPSVELDSEIASVHAHHQQGVPRGRGILAYTSSLDAAFVFADAVAQGWIVEHFADDASGTIGSMKAFGATCELSDGSQNIQGQSFNRATAVMVSALRVLDTIAKSDKAAA
jgi:hypothetical protein